MSDTKLKHYFCLLLVILFGGQQANANQKMDELFHVLLAHGLLGSYERLDLTEQSRSSTASLIDREKFAAELKSLRLKDLTERADTICRMEGYLFKCQENKFSLRPIIAVDRMNAKVSPFRIQTISVGSALGKINLHSSTKLFSADFSRIAEKYSTTLRVKQGDTVRAVLDQLVSSSGLAGWIATIAPSPESSIEELIIVQFSTKS